MNRYFKIVVLLILPFLAFGQKFRSEIQDYNSVVNLRNETLAPKKNDKAFIQTTKHLYSYDWGNTTSSDDGLKYIVQTSGSYRWVCLNCHLRVELSQDSILLQYDANNVLVQRDTIRLTGGGPDKFHTNIVATTAYDPLNPLAGLVAPTNPIAGNTVEVKFTDGAVGNYTYDGSAWIPDFQQTWAEQRICLNTAAVAFTPADLNNPLVSEVDAWAIANLTIQQRENGTQLVYFVVGDGGSCDNPDYVWTLNKGSQLVTLTNKRVFNTKTVYVDAGSGSDVTGRRGYREFPFKTLDAAIGVIQDGDLLKVFPGSYVSNVSSDRIFHIDCDNGVNWQYTVPLTSARALTEPTTVNWNFDKLFTTITNIGNLESPSLLTACNYGINLNINYANYIFVHNSGTSKNFYSASWNIKNSYNSHFNCSTLTNTVTGPVVSINIDNIYKTDDLWVVQRQVSQNTVLTINVGNIYYTSTGTLSYSNVFNISAGSESSTHNKVTNYFIKSISSLKNVPLVTNSLFTNNSSAEIGSTAQHSNTLFRTQTVSNGDNNSINFTNGKYEIHTIGQSFSTAQRFNNIYRYNVSGLQKNGFTYYSTQNLYSNDNVVYLNLDVISENHAAVYIGLDGTILDATSTIYISGRIKTTRSGFPCIILGNNQNNRIVLKDLTLINDGTVSPIMINSVSPENVQIQNVTSNSLISDPNITEVGQSIIRNINYK